MAKFENQSTDLNRMTRRTKEEINGLPTNQLCKVKSYPKIEKTSRAVKLTKTSVKPIFDLKGAAERIGCVIGEDGYHKNSKV